MQKSLWFYWRFWKWSPSRNNGSVLSRIISACNFTKINTPPWMFFTVFKLCKWYQVAQRITIFEEVMLYTLKDKIWIFNLHHFTVIHRFNLYINLKCVYFYKICIFSNFGCKQDTAWENIHSNVEHSAKKSM